MAKAPAGLLHMRAQPSDGPALRALTRAAYAPWVSILGREPLPMTVDYDKALELHRFDVLYKGDDICALLETEKHAQCLWIENVAVSPALHGQGIGRWLLDLAREIAMEAGRNKLTLYTNAKMTRNIAIYQKYGFHVEREEILEQGTAVHMFMDIKP